MGCSFCSLARRRLLCHRSMHGALQPFRGESERTSRIIGTSWACSCCAGENFSARCSSRTHAVTLITHAVTKQTVCPHLSLNKIIYGAKCCTIITTSPLQIHTCGYPVGSRSVEDHVLSFRERVLEARDYGAVLVNSHTGCDAWPLADALRCLRACAAVEAEAGVPVAHETHRQRILFNPWVTRDVLNALPEIHVNVRARFPRCRAAAPRAPLQTEGSEGRRANEGARRRGLRSGRSTAGRRRAAPHTTRSARPTPRSEPPRGHRRACCMMEAAMGLCFGFGAAQAGAAGAWHQSAPRPRRGGL